MRISAPTSFYRPITFGSNARHYISESGNEIGTNSWTFRNDIDWKELSNYEIEHFKNKKNVNFIQFAASDGSEAYTQIISLLENGGNVDKFFPIQAYDIDEEITQKANSGLINLRDKDFNEMHKLGVDYNKYFQKTQHELCINRDHFLWEIPYPTTCKVADSLKERVKFNNKDMYHILSTLEDDSNTIIMCRNLLLYFDNIDIETFIRTVSNRLKKDSLLVIGKLDKEGKLTEKYMKQYNFKEVLPNVYKKLLSSI